MEQIFHITIQIRNRLKQSWALWERYWKNGELIDLLYNTYIYINTSMVFTFQRGRSTEQKLLHVVNFISSALKQGLIFVKVLTLKKHSMFARTQFS